MLVCSRAVNLRQKPYLKTWGESSIYWRSKGCTARPMSRHAATSLDTLIVVLLMTALSSIAVPNLARVSSNTRSALFASTLRELQAAVDSFYLTSNRLPATFNATSTALIDFSAADTYGKAFAPWYIRQRPDTSAVKYGLRSETQQVFFGVTDPGRVFATLQPPDHNNGWSQLTGTLFTSSAPSGVDAGSLAVKPVNSPDADLGVAALSISSSHTQVMAGTKVTITARALSSSGEGVPNARLRFDIAGSATGRRSVSAVTNAEGLASVEITTNTAEAVLVTAVYDG